MTLMSFLDMTLKCEVAAQDATIASREDAVVAVDNMVRMQRMLYRRGRRLIEEAENGGDGLEDEVRGEGAEYGDDGLEDKVLGAKLTLTPSSSKIQSGEAVLHGPWHMKDLIHTKPEYIVMTFSTLDYMPASREWYNQLVERGVTNHWIIVYRDHVVDNVRDVDCAGNPMRLLISEHHADKSFKSVMAWRVHAMQHLLKHNVSILAADTDTIWLKNPLNTFFSRADRNAYDLIISYGTTFPDVVYKAWGHVMCMGMVYIRAGNPGLHALKRLDVECSDKCDDQRIINQYLAFHSNVSWSNSSTQGPKGALTGRGLMPEKLPSFKLVKGVAKEVPPPKIPWKFYDGPRIEINVKMIPEVAVQRRYVAQLDYKSAYVLHPVLPKSGGGKTSGMHDVMKIFDFQRDHSWHGTGGVNTNKAIYNPPPKRTPKKVQNPPKPKPAVNAKAAKTTADLEEEKMASKTTAKPKAKAKAKPKAKAKAKPNAKSSKKTSTPTAKTNSRDAPRAGDDSSAVVTVRNTEEAMAFRNSVDFKKAQMSEAKARADGDTMKSILGAYGVDTVAAPH